LFILLVKLFELELPDPFKGIKKILEPLIVSQESIDDLPLNLEHGRPFERSGKESGGAYPNYCKKSFNNTQG